MRKKIFEMLVVVFCVFSAITPIALQANSTEALKFLNFIFAAAVAVESMKVGPVAMVGVAGFGAAIALHQAKDSDSKNVALVCVAPATAAGIVLVAKYVTK